MISEPSPTLVASDAADGLRSNPALCRDYALRPRIATDFAYCGLGKFDSSVARTPSRRAVTDAISVVFRERAPTQIRERVVGWIAVKMSALHAIWAGADKSLKDKSVDTLTARFLAWLAQTDVQMAALFHPGLQNAFTDGQRTPIRAENRPRARLDTSQIRDLIIRKLGNVAPNLAGDVRIVVRHSGPPAAALLKRARSVACRPRSAIIAHHAL